MPDVWKDICARKQQERTSRIPADWLLPFSFSPEAGRKDVLHVPRICGLLSSEQIRITEEYDVTTLLSHLANGTLTSIQTVTAFAKRAAIAQQLTNCLTEIFFQDGIERAKQLDEHFRKTGKPVGPLHGLPISIKDTFQVKGYDASIGYADLCFKPSTKNSPLVDFLLAQGAVLYCKTNVPLTLGALDSHNNVFGRTLNPYNLKLTAGGSSGGEGALVAMRGSPLGIGTDVGGSIRIPAMCNGLVGVKPSHGRVPNAGQSPALPDSFGKIGIEVTTGPIARTVKDCEVFMRIVGNGLTWQLDPDVIPQPWSAQPSLNMTPQSTTRQRRPILIGLARTDGHVTPLPPIAKVMDQVSSALRNPKLPHWHDVELIEIDLSRFGPPSLKTFNGVMTIDGGQETFKHLEATGEPLSPWLKPRLRKGKPKATAQILDIQTQKTKLQTQFLNVWKESGGYWKTSSPRDGKTSSADRSLDAIVFPTAPHPVPAIDSWNTSNYTAMFNTLDLPAGVLPLRPIVENDLRDELPRGSKALNGWDTVNRRLWEEVEDRRVYLGGVMSLQVITPKLHERVLVEVMSVLEGALKEVRSMTEVGAESGRGQRSGGKL